KPSPFSGSSFSKYGGEAGLSVATVGSPAGGVSIFEGVQLAAVALAPSPSPALDEELDFLPPQPASRASPRARTETMARVVLRIGIRGQGIRDRKRGILSVMRSWLQSGAGDQPFQSF